MTAILHRQARTRDADEQATLLSGWNQSYAQISAGAFEGSVEEAWIGDLQLFIEGTGQSLLQGGALPADRLALGIPMAVPRPAVFCGAEGGLDAVYAFSGAGGFEFSTPAGLVMAGCSLPRQALEARLTAPERAWLHEAFARPHLRRPKAERLATMRCLLACAFDGLRAAQEGEAHAQATTEAVGRALREATLSNLADLLVDGMQTEELPASRRWRIVTEARRLTLDEPDRPLSVASLCATLGVSRRTLQNCFHDVMGVSPAAFLRAVRLAGVRRMLRTAPSVTEAAAHWGFWHFGHFANDYKRMFGELPSQSWRRWHGSGRQGVAH